ncbi:MAG: acyl-CoA dehydrogenase [Chloroflexi bacterium]|nr:acyl-CoA dehydrogenase [Chloroflexota bacterium]
MDFSWSKEQREFKSAVIKFAQNELNDGIIERDEKGEFSYENWKKCADFGIHGLAFPEEYGGSGADIMTTMLVMEGLGFGSKDNGLFFAINAQMWSVMHPIMHFGTEEQKQKYLPRLCSGEIIGAHGMTEPDSGSDAYSLRTRAEKVDGGYIINGAKMFVTSAPICDVAVVFATVDPAKGIGGVTGFIIEKGTKGFSLSPAIHKMGLRTSPWGELIMENVFVPDENRIGREGAGVSIFSSSMEWERSCILASHIGAMERQLKESVRYARQRRQFGKPIGKFQSVSNRLADMKVRLETSRLLLYKVAWLKSQRKPAIMEAALAKLYLSECFVQNSMDSLRTYGGYGYTTEYEIEREVRDSIGGLLYSGTSDIQRTIIGRLMGL